MSPTIWPHNVIYALLIWIFIGPAKFGAIMLLTLRFVCYGRIVYIEIVVLLCVANNPPILKFFAAHFIGSI